MISEKPILIIEHLEPELFEWCLIEYKHISKIMGKNNLWLTNIKKKDRKKLEKFGKILTQSVKNLSLEKACILDPEAKSLFNPQKAKLYKYIIIGGILGSFPSKKRTARELSSFLPEIKKYHLGKKQMSTDTAVYVAKKIIDGSSLHDLKFQDSPEIKINSVESTILPYRYIRKGKGILISPALLNYLKKP